MANSYLSRSTGTTNKTTFTVSVWAKRALNGARQVIWSSDKQTNDTGDGTKGGSGIGLQFWNDDQFYLGGFGGNFQIRSNGLQRDNNGWYHIVAQIDTTQADQNNRAKLWINGENVSSLTAMVGQNTDVKFATNRIGVKSETANYSDPDSLLSYYDGYLAHLHVCDGQTYQASDFGQTNSTTGIWSPIVSPSVTYGSDGYFLKFENSGSLGVDSSGNGNNFTTSGSLLQSRSTPTNLFNTINSVDCSANASQIKVSATQLYATGGGDIATRGTLGVNSGKWYWECKSIISAGHGNRKMVGFYDGSSPVGNGRALSSYKGVLVDLQTGTVYKDGSTSGTTNISSFSNGDIVGVFFDADNGEMRFSKNGNMENSGNAVATGVDMSNYLYLPYISQDGGGTNNGDMNCNFGEGYFATTAVSSGNADANGYGQFEYNPVVSSTNYYALCTKNMEQF